MERLTQHEISQTKGVPQPPLSQTRQTLIACTMAEAL